MDERTWTPNGDGADDGDEELARLLAAAGPRPKIPAKDLAAIADTTAVAWRAQVTAAPPPPLAWLRRRSRW